MHNTITCFSPLVKLSSLIFPAINPPNTDSSRAVCRNTRLDASVDNTGLMKDTPVEDILAIGANIIVEIIIMMNRKITTEK